MTTASTPVVNTNPVVSFFSGLVSDIKSFFGSAIGLEVTEFVASAAGCASGLAVIEEVNPSDKSGTATDIFTLCSAALSLLSGTIRFAYFARSASARSASAASPALARLVRSSRSSAVTEFLIAVSTSWSVSLSGSRPWNLASL